MVKTFAVRSKDKLVYVVPNVKASITRDVQSHVKDMNSDDMETFRVLIDEEVDMMIGQVQDDHRITEPAATDPAHDAPHPEEPEPFVPAEPIQPAEPVRPSEPIRFDDPIRRKEPARFDEPVRFEEPVHHDIPVFIPEQPVDHVPKAPRPEEPVFVQASKPLRPTEPVRPSEQPAAPPAPVTFVEVHAPSPYAQDLRRRAAELYRCARGLLERAWPVLQARYAALKQSITASAPWRRPRILPPRDARSALTPSRSSTATRQRSPSTPSPPSAVGTPSGAN